MNGRRKVDAEREATEVTYILLNMDSDHSESTMSDRLLTNPDVDAVVVDLTTKGVTVHGQGLDVLALRALIENAGYQAA
jgi:hypothetical protein